MTTSRTAKGVGHSQQLASVAAASTVSCFAGPTTARARDPSPHCFSRGREVPPHGAHEFAIVGGRHHCGADAGIGYSAIGPATLGNATDAIESGAATETPM